MTSNTAVTTIHSHHTRNGKKKIPNSCMMPATIPSRPYHRGSTPVRSASADVDQTTTALTIRAATHAK